MPIILIDSVLFQAVLAAIIYVNLHGMMKQFMDVPALWKTNRVDMVSGGGGGAYGGVIRRLGGESGAT